MNAVAWNILASRTGPVARLMTGDRPSNQSCPSHSKLLQLKTVLKNSSSFKTSNSTSWKPKPNHFPLHVRTNQSRNVRKRILNGDGTIPERNQNASHVSADRIGCVTMDTNWFQTSDKTEVTSNNLVRHDQGCT